MRSVWALLLAGWVACASVPACGQVPTALGGYVLAADDHPPFIDPRAPHGGAAVAAVRALFAEAGLGEVRLLIVPWLRAYQMVKDGDADVSAPFRWTEVRAQEVLYGPALVVERPAFYVADGSAFSADSFAGLSGLSLCSPLGFALDAAVDQMVRSGALSLHAPSGEGSCLAMLRDGRAELMVATPLRLGGLTAKPPHREGLRPLPIYLEPAPLHLILSRRRPDADALAARLAAAAARMGLPDRFGRFFPGAAAQFPQ